MPRTKTSAPKKPVEVSYSLTQLKEQNPDFNLIVKIANQPITGQLKDVQSAPTITKNDKKKKSRR